MPPLTPAWALLTAMGLAISTSQAAIIDYKIDAFTSNDSLPSPNHWAYYPNFTGTNFTRSPSSNADDTAVLAAVANFTMPFYDIPAAKFFVDSNGFLTLSPRSMCISWCDGLSGAGQYRYRAATATVAASGGDWPLIGLYVMDLNPEGSHDPSSGIFVHLFRNRYGAGVDSVFVEYRNVSQYRPTTTADATTLNGHIELLSNGTIFFRYQSVIATFVQKAPPTAGLVLRKRQRLAVAAPSRVTTASGTPDIVAYRFEPVADVCAASTACAACGSGCAWCDSTSTCMNATVAASVCPPRDVLTNCRRDFSEDQVFYTSRYLPAGSLVSNAIAWSPLTTADSYPVMVPIPFDFPFFEFPTPPHVPSKTSRSLAVHNTGFISVLSQDAYCSQQLQICTNHTILPFSSTPFAIDAEADMAVRVALLPDRNGSATICPSVLQNSSGTCPSAVVIEIASLATRTLQFPQHTAINVTMRVLVDALGAIVVGLSRAATAGGGDVPLGQPLTAYPPAVTGVTRYSAIDPSSELAPELVLGLFDIHYRPVQGCFDCRGRGRCDNATYKCQCNNATRGEGCEVCNAGYFGAACAVCPRCLNGGRCDDGSGGSGRCFCPEPWSGETCDVQCVDSDPRPLDCPGCNLAGARCLCGRCQCKSALGWSGPNCSDWTDPCAQWSLDGCQTCLLSSSAPRCLYCGIGEYTCVADATQPGIPKAVASSRSCRYAIDFAQMESCPRYSYPVLAGVGSSSASLLVIVGVFVGLAIIVCGALLMIGCCRTVAPNPLLVEAVRGVPPKAIPRREREVLAVEPIRGAPIGKLLQAIPLKQMSLLELYEQQQPAANSPRDDDEQTS